MIYDELIQGTTIFTVSEDGSETISIRPPTSKELRAARALKSLVDQLEGLVRANATLQKELDDLRTRTDNEVLREQSGDAQPSTSDQPH